MSLAPVDLGPLVAHCAAMVEPAAVRRGVSLQVQLAADAQDRKSTRLNSSHW